MINFLPVNNENFNIKYSNDTFLRTILKRAANNIALHINDRFIEAIMMYVCLYPNRAITQLLILYADTKAIACIIRRQYSARLIATNYLIEISAYLQIRMENHITIKTSSH